MSERLYPYAIVAGDAGHRSGTTLGIRDAEVTLVRLGAVGVWISRLSPFEAQPADLLAHHRVVEAVAAAGAALPVRFGTSFADGAALERALAPRADALLAALARVGAKRELALTLAWTDPGPTRQE